MRDEAVEGPSLEGVGVVSSSGERLVDDGDRPPDDLEGGAAAAARRVRADGLGDRAARLVDKEVEAGIDDLEERERVPSVDRRADARLSVEDGGRGAAEGRGVR